MWARIVAGEIIGAPRAYLEAKARKDAANGDVNALYFLNAVAETDRLLGRPPRGRGITSELFNAWSCPACGSRARTGSDRAGTLTCSQGHVRALNSVERSPILRRLVNRT